MSSSLSKDDRTLGDALRRIGGRHIAQALQAIEDRSAADAVHEVRRSCKKLRGLIRLVRTGFDDFADEDDAIREIAHPLSGVRDAKVLLDTFDSLAERAQGHAAREVMLRLHHVLKTQRETQREAARAEDLLDNARQELLTMEARCRLWAVEGEGWTIVGEGVAMTYSHMLKGADRAFANGQPDEFHKLRKHVRYHWCHAQLLEPLWLQDFEARAATADELAHALGIHHDIAVCSSWFRSEGLTLCAPDEEAPLLALAAREMNVLEERVRKLCGQLLAEPADALLAHWQALWRNWQAPPR